MSAETI